jgi:outer membrane protein
MKRIAIAIALIVAATFSSLGQRFAYIDSDYIMENIPEYKAAELEIERISIEWQKELEEKFAEIEQMFRAYQAEAPLLPEEIRRQREETIVSREQSAKELQMKRFGRDGELFQKRQELMQPIQDRIFDAVKEIATRGNYAVIFDKSGGVTMLYTDVRYDLSDEVLQRLGYRR